MYNIMFRCTTEWFTSFTGYPSFIVIIKYWLCSLCCTIYFCSLFILYILVGPSFFIQFNSVAQSCPTLCDPMDCSMPGFPVHHRLPELAQNHFHRVGDVIQPTHPVVPFSFWLQFKEKLCLAALGLSCCIWLSLVAVVSGPTLHCFVVASLVAEHGLQVAWASVGEAYGLSSFGAWA